MCEAEAGARRVVVLHDGRELPAVQRRALELLDCMKRHGKAWSLYVFSSANAIRQYDMRQLVELGVEWIWLGLESPAAAIQAEGGDTLALTRELQAHGICVLGSSIVGLEHHTPDNIMAGDRTCRVARRRVPPVHAVHADAGDAAARRGRRARGGCSRT
jgi:hypothetical protein